MEMLTITRHCGHWENVRVHPWESRNEVRIRESKATCNTCFFGRPVSAYFGSEQHRYEETGR
jgi:hypothetical protein